MNSRNSLCDALDLLFKTTEELEIGEMDKPWHSDMQCLLIYMSLHIYTKYHQWLWRLFETYHQWASFLLSPPGTWMIRT